MSLAAVRARIARFAQQDDHDAVLEEGAVADLLTLLQSTSSDDVDANRAAAYFCIMRFQVLPDEEDRLDYARALELFRPLRRLGTAHIPEHLYEDLDQPTPQFVGDQAARLLIYASHTNELVWLDTASDYLRFALRTTPHDGPDRVAYLMNLHAAWGLRYRQTDALEDLSESIRAARAVLTVLEPASRNWVDWTFILGKHLMWRYRAAGVFEDLDNAVDHLKAAVSATESDHPDRMDRLKEMAIALGDRADHRSDHEDLDPAVEAVRAAIGLAKPESADESALCSQLSQLLRLRSDQRGDLTDLAEAINLSRAALAAAADDSTRVTRLSRLGIALRSSFDLTGRIADLDEAIEYLRAAAALTDQPWEQTKRLSNLVDALRVRAERTGRVEDADEAVALARRMVAMTPPEDVDRSVLLSTLAITLHTRFSRTNERNDLDEAVEASRQAAETVADDRPVDAVIVRTNLSALLLSRFERLRDSGDVDEAIVVARRIMAALPSADPSQDERQSNLALALLTRYQQVPPARASDGDEAVALMREALGATGADHPRLASRLSNLVYALLCRYRNGDGHPADLDDAVVLGEKAVAECPSDDANLAMYLANLAAARQARHQLTGDLDDARAVVSADRRASSLRIASPSVRLDVARSWGRAATVLENWPGAVAGYSEAVQLIGTVAPRGLARIDAEHALSSLSGLGADAAACCLLLGDAGRAVSLWDQAVGVLLAQALDARTDITDLARADTTLAQQFVELSDRLEDGGMLATALTGERRRALVVQFEDLLRRIRQLREFRGFLQPPDIGDLLRTAQQGPVVVTMVSELCSAALVLTTEGVAVVDLPDATPETVREHVTTVLACTDETEDNERLHRTLEWMWDATAEVDILARQVAARTEFIGNDARRDDILAALPHHPWAHFCCHGHSDPDAPSASRLLVMDYERVPLAVADISRLRLEDAEFAFLSACSTARTGEHLSDEAIHLASAFQLAGYRHVVATLWPIMDRHAVWIADKVYATISKQGAAAAARALHTATRELREVWRDFPDVWAGHIHSGA
ncbi:CHAT domain-containing protein [Actinocrispum wychmicini]|uniref:CHAT domain-containing protein n=1 Tax=Actinocrispum wychmicini TaxID=1213861 RepID=A0A4R2JJD8_9PSEU|nr:CHAT domain-containing protein [Actinocrispum wychmicini]TCO59234.1 CHAT domain-containing protein [Actinocrispum wychmicini]